MNCSQFSTRLLAALTLTLTACSTDHEFRVASVGDGSGNATSETTSTIPSAPLFVAAGNVLLGSSAVLGPINSPALTNGVVNGTVSAVLLTSGQSLVQLTDGTSLVINSVGGALGDTVSIDVGKGQVVGGPSALVGVSITPSAGGAGGQLASTTIGGTTLAVAPGGVGTSLTGTAGQTLGTASATTSLTQPVTTVGSGLTGTVSPLCC